MKILHHSPRRKPRAQSTPSACASGYYRFINLAFIVCSLHVAGCTPPGKPVPPAPNADNSFDKLYATHCAGCHGADGKYGSGPMLNNANFLHYIGTEDYLNQVITNGRKNTAMPAFAISHGGPLTTSQIRTLVLGIRTMANHVNYPTWDPKLLDGKGQADRGAEIYKKDCARCHGEDGVGKEAGAIHNTAMIALMSDKYLFRICLLGRSDLGCGEQELTSPRMTVEQAHDLAAFLASWRRQP